VLGLGVTLTGCTPEPKLVTQSNVAAGFSNHRLKRVLIAIYVRSPARTENQNASLLQAAELKRAFDAKWPPLGIAIEVVDADGAPDNGGPLLTAANTRFRSTEMLILQTKSLKLRGAFVEDYEIDASLYHGAPRKLVWRGATELPSFYRVSATPSKRPEAADRYVDSLTAKLREDGLI
jgi:hypothetical protein